LKVFEALAAGIMPVCTDFSVDLETLGRDRHALLGRSADTFVAAVEEAIARDSEESRERLSKFGRQQTWEARWAQMRSVIDPYRKDPDHVETRRHPVVPPSP